MKIDKKKMMLCLLAVGAVIVILWIYFSSRPQTPPPEIQQPEKRAELKVDTLQSGYGNGVVKPGDLIAVNYIGSLEGNIIFESSLSSGKPFETYIGKGEAPKGWDEGLIGMRVGEKRKLVVPPELAYDSEVNGNIPKNSTLYYEIELVDIK